jgi:alpha-galactosidase
VCSSDLSASEHGNDPIVKVIEALSGFAPFEYVGNYRNIGQIPQLPLDSVVETRCRYDSAGIHPFVSPMPTLLEILVRPHVLRQEALIGIALNGSFDELVALVATDPLCSHLDFGQCRGMVRAMLEANRSLIANPRLLEFS